MPPKQELLLIRHGQSTANATGVWQGQLDFQLSDEGREQARRTGLALAGEEVSGFYSSPLMRAFETTRIITGGREYAGEVVPMPGLMERQGGILEGTTRQEREASNPRLMEKLARLPEDEQWPLVGAETDEEVLERFSEALDGTRAGHAPGDRLVIVSHGGAMRAFLRDLFGDDVLPDSERAPNASITRFRWNPDGSEPELLELASTQHLL